MDSKKPSLALAYSIKRKSKVPSPAPLKAEEAYEDTDLDLLEDEIWEDDEELIADAPETKEQRVARIMQGFRTKGLSNED